MNTEKTVAVMLEELRQEWLNAEGRVFKLRHELTRVSNEMTEENDKAEDAYTRFTKFKETIK